MLVCCWLHWFCSRVSRRECHHCSNVAHKSCIIAFPVRYKIPVVRKTLSQLSEEAALGQDRELLVWVPWEKWLWLVAVLPCQLPSAGINRLLICVVCCKHLIICTVGGIGLHGDTYLYLIIAWPNCIPFRWSTYDCVCAHCVHYKGYNNIVVSGSLAG